MWSYYGSKSKIAKLYPAPKHDLIIEPFAGAAWYSVLHNKKNVLLNEKNDVIHQIWHWLINEADPELILRHKDFYLGQDISQLDLGNHHKDLIGFCVNRGSATPKSVVQKWSCQVKSKPNWASTTAFALERVARLLPDIKHWRVVHGDYRDLPNIEATWFIDPPYKHGGEHYPSSAADIDYDELAMWCKSRKGQVIVCENSKSDWLPFEPLTRNQGQREKTVEVVFIQT